MYKKKIDRCLKLKRNNKLNLIYSFIATLRKSRAGQNMLQLLYLVTH